MSQPELAAYPPSALQHLAQADAVLAELIARYGLVERERNRPPLHALVSAIVGQRISMKAAAAIMGRLLALFPAGGSSTPASWQRCRSINCARVGLSTQKPAICDLASTIASGALDLDALPGARRRGDRAAVPGERHWALDGQDVLIFSLGRLDVLAVDDLGLRAGIQRAYGMAELPRAAAFAPWPRRGD